MGILNTKQAFFLLNFSFLLAVRFFLPFPILDEKDKYFHFTMQGPSSLRNIFALCLRSPLSLKFSFASHPAAVFHPSLSPFYQPKKFTVQTNGLWPQFCRFVSSSLHFLFNFYVGQMFLFP
jgi:hypothetical protein